MPPYPNTFAPSKKTRDVGLADTIIPLANTRVLVVVAGTTLAPDTLVIRTASGPDTVAAALTGMPVIGTDEVYGTTSTYSNNTATADGLVGVTKMLPKMSWRIRSNVAFQYQSDLDAIIGLQYVLATTTDADGFDYQVLDVAGGDNSTYGLKVVDGDIASQTLLIECLCPII